MASPNLEVHWVKLHIGIQAILMKKVKFFILITCRNEKDIMVVGYYLFLSETRKRLYVRTHW